MYRVLVFFPYFLWALLMMDVPWDSSNVARGQEKNSAPPSSELYKQAVEKLGGPSRVFYLPNESASGKDWSTEKIAEDFGVVIQWNDKNVVLVRPDASRETKIVTDSVIRIVVGWQADSFRSAHTFFEQGKHKEFIELASKLLSDKESTVPNWQRKVLMAELISSLIAVERWERGAKLFEQFLAKDQPPSLLATIVPIPWMDSTAAIRDRPKLVEAAASWLQDENEWIVLLGASWGLDGSLRAESLRTLERLSKSPNPLIGLFAEAQRWRTIPPQEFLSSRYSYAKKLQSSAPLPWLAGPTFLLGERLNQANATDLALEEWLRVIVLHSDHEFLSQAARKAAANALRQNNREAEAKSVETLFRKN